MFQQGKTKRWQKALFSELPFPFQWGKVPGWQGCSSWHSGQLRSPPLLAAEPGLAHLTDGPGEAELGASAQQAQRWPGAASDPSQTDLLPKCQNPCFSLAARFLSCFSPAARFPPKFPGFSLQLEEIWQIHRPRATCPATKRQISREGQDEAQQLQNKLGGCGGGAKP